ncbi:hypothetical protein BCR44DRAFT_46436 [Catenaria anguillulae PL171]|uniref:Secreted protein n=1 Tax=Catenaria anguillulae PL171 TaxID=765915 RepID=A0A1Y2HAW8_9FUNG|nr:hypothetical protein BCR44DRAFT_46436 [Catenaria anguillulae PL171]
MRLTVCWKLFAGCVVLSFGGCWNRPRCEQPPCCACGVGGQEGSSPVCTIYDDNGVLCCHIPLLSPMPSDLQANRHSFIDRPPLWHRRAFLGRQQHSCSCGPDANQPATPNTVAPIGAPAALQPLMLDVRKVLAKQCPLVFSSYGSILVLSVFGRSRN